MKKSLSFITTIFLLLLFSVLGNAEERDIKPFAKDAVEKGWGYFNNGDLETALKRFHQATIIDPEFAPRYFGKAYIYSVQNKLNLAIDPNNGDAHINIAQSFCEQKQNKKAWEHIEKAQQLKARVAPELLEEMKAECPSN